MEVYYIAKTKLSGYLFTLTVCVMVLLEVALAYSGKWAQKNYGFDQK